ncbi:kinase-like domain-containing protein [Endogone sp. FLAS-F59071]|nr:kinase-like domain-containing protein [Endogone sp. FLAS-F59071]|eukprot:RUS16829.1 kinase-like domain-containing protein [Endogone sp. FLAS-F59071]
MSTPNSEPLSAPQSPLSAPQSPLSANFGSKKPRPPSVVIETLGATTIETEDGFKQINQYMLKKEIGRGAFGTVHLGVDKDTGIEYTMGPKYYFQSHQINLLHSRSSATNILHQFHLPFTQAVKEFSKSRLRRKEKMDVLRKPGPRGRGRGRFGLGVSSARVAPGAEDKQNPLDLVRTEVVVLKKLNHDNVVKLHEVLDDPNDDSLYMVFEMCHKGVLMDVDVERVAKPYSDEECRHYFREMVLGIEYLHENDIVHRDIKPDNLLLSKDDVLKIVDFGVSEMFVKGNDRMKKSAGSPAFMAPELCVARHGEVAGRPADIWSMGVTLYCLKYGKLPFAKSNMIELFDSIKSDPIYYPPDTDTQLLDLFLRLFERDPSKRITMPELRAHPWLTKDGTDPLLSTEDNTLTVVTEVTDQEIKDAIKSVVNIFTVMRAVTKFKRHSRTLSQAQLAALMEKTRELDTNDTNDTNDTKSSATLEVHQEREVTIEQTVRTDGGGSDVQA